MSPTPTTLDLDGFDDFASDQTKEKDGVWMTVPGKDGARIKLRSSDSAKVRDVAAKISRRHLPLIRTGKPIPAEAQDEDQAELLAREIVVAWEGFARKDGSLLPCNKETVRAVMLALPKLRELCIQYSDEQENYRIEERKELEGNSAQS